MYMCMYVFIYLFIDVTFHFIMFHSMRLPINTSMVFKPFNIIQPYVPYISHTYVVIPIPYIHMSYIFHTYVRYFHIFPCISTYFHMFLHKFHSFAGDSPRGWDAPLQGGGEERLEAEAQLTEKWCLDRGNFYAIIVVHT